ncbi:MAG: hypothetical protein ABI665_04375 [Vicinamibacterales bacterium]
MLTDMVRHPSDATKFVLRGVAWSLAVFGVLRLPWIEAHAVLPITRLQAAVAVGLLGAPRLPVEVTLACSGADAMALCLAAVLAYPVGWRARLQGAFGGAALILAINTIRIGTLGRVAASPGWFLALHLYVWPAILILAIAGYVFTWMRLADRPRATGGAVDLAQHRLTDRLQPSTQFIVLAGVLLLLFVAASPFYLESAGVLALAAVIARGAAAVLNVAGITAHTDGNVLWTARSAVMVTQECISTPLIPVYLAAVLTYSGNWKRLALGILATVPLFMALGAARLLLVALPGLVIAPIFFVHAFYQLLLGAVVVYIAARWRHGHKSAPGYAAAGVLAGALFILWLGPFYTRIVIAQPLTPFNDPQGAITLLPSFQIGLYLALWVAAFGWAGWRPFVAGLALLGLTQATGLLALNTLAAHAAMALHVRNVRGWAVAGPIVIFAMVVNLARTRR